ncbi:MAG: exodeoxyribonuclease VII large subunit [Pseudomonadota bacterium]
MSDLIDDDRAGENAPEFTVAELSGKIKALIEGQFSHVRIRGEIGAVKRYASGHIYYDLKDEDAVINAVTFKGQAARMQVQPEEGLEVIAIGKITTYARQSKYQMNITELRVAGVGALMAQLERRKQALAKEGLFDQDRKKTIPYLPQIIGVVTSPQGAVIRDILHRLRDRFPRKVLIWPVAVQGDRCAPEVAKGIAGFNALTPGGAMPRPDLIIVARGGGSLEDLWGFNEEIVVRAAAASDIPLISAVGHETDTTLIDFAADHRAPTPTAAAELAVPVRHDLALHLNQLDDRRQRALGRAIEAKRQRLADLSRAIRDPKELLQTAQQRLDLAATRLPQGLRNAVQNKRRMFLETSAKLQPKILLERIKAQRDRTNRAGSEISRALPKIVSTRREKLDAQIRLLESLGYHATLERGYAVVRKEDKVVTTAEAAGDAALEIEFKDGRVAVEASKQGRLL